jgi:hypothetical protein
VTETKEEVLAHIPNKNKRIQVVAAMSRFGRRGSDLTISAEASIPPPGSTGGRSMQDCMQSSMEFTAGGSLEYKGFKINTGGVQHSPDRMGPVSTFQLSDVRFLNVLGR